MEKERKDGRNNENDESMTHSTQGAGRETSAERASSS